MTALVTPYRHMPNDLALAADPLRPLAFAVRDGEALAFTHLYERTREQAWRVLYRVVGQSPDLEDLLQESYLQLMRALKRFISWWQSLFTPQFVLAGAVGAALVVGGAWFLANPPLPVAATQHLTVPAAVSVPKTRSTPLQKQSATVASSKKSNALLHQKLEEGSTVATKSGGSVWLKLPDGSQAGLTASAEVTLATLQEKQLTLNLVKGGWLWWYPTVKTAC